MNFWSLMVVVTLVVGILLYVILTDMSWELLILISVLVYSVSVLMQRSLIKSDSSNPGFFAVLFQLICGLLIGIFGLITNKLEMPNFSPLIIPLLVMVFLYALGNVFLFQGLKQIEAARFTIVFSSRALVTVFASSLLFRESMSYVQFLGVLLVLAGVVIVNLKAAKLTITKKERPAILAAIFYGLANVNDRYLVQNMELYSFVSLAFLLPAIATFIFDKSAHTDIKSSLKNQPLGPMIALGLVYSLGAVSFFNALQIAPITSQAVTANLASVVVIVILSAIFLKERDNMARKILAALITFVGLVLIGS
jgi:drug/metabolite transporter (DMT)-like permease